MPVSAIFTDSLWRILIGLSGGLLTLGLVAVWLRRRALGWVSAGIGLLLLVFLLLLWKNFASAEAAREIGDRMAADRLDGDGDDD